MSDPVRVPLEMECPCPGRPHEREWVELAPRLSIIGGAAAMSAIREAGSTTPEVEAAITQAFVRHGITAWSFTGEPDARGARDSVPITSDTIARLLDWGGAAEVADRANELYSEDLARPLARRLAASSSGGPTAPSTSATTASGRAPRRPSAPSSPSATDGKPSGDPAP